MDDFNHTTVASTKFLEKDQICHSLIEAAIFNQNSNDYVLSMLTRLKNYADKHGNDIIIDTLFMKYLKKTSAKHYKEEINNFNAKLIKKRGLSQYVISYVCFNDPKSKFNYKKQIQEQSYKIFTNEIITVNGIKMSKVICFYLLRYLFKSITKDLKINHDKFYNCKDDIRVFKSKHYDCFNSKEKNELTKEYKNISKEIHQYYSLDFWKNIVIYNIMKNYTIDVNSNSYLFHAAACLSYQNPLIKTKFDISNLALPEKITIDLIPLIKSKLPLDDLLDIIPYSIETKNLCSFIYFLVLNHVSFENLDQYKNSMNPESFKICQYVYRNYSNSNQVDLLDIMPSKIDIKNEDDFVMLLLLRSFDKNEYNRYLIDQPNKDLIYIASKSVEFTKWPISSGSYSIIKKDINEGNILKYEENEIIQNYFDDFDRFIEKAINYFYGTKKTDSIKLYISNNKSIGRKIEMIFELIYLKEYDDAIVLLNKLNQTNEVKNILMDDLHFQSIKELLKCVNIESACEFIKKMSIEEMLTTSEKLDMILQINFSKQKIKISRENLLDDSISEFDNKVMHHKIVRISYESEKGIDQGGLSKDWFTNVNNEINKSKAFIPTPNGTSLTFNNQVDNSAIYKFVGQLIASALINKRNIDFKLSSFIWKRILDEKIDLEDMKDYDEEIYQSLKWISENDPKPLMMTFVDSYDNELCFHGQNQELTEENKEEFISLMIENKLIKPNKESIDQIKLGFREIIDMNLISIFKWNEIKEIINGKDIIDIDDWKKYTKYDFQYEQKYHEFFSIISKWPQKKLKKLLIFATGTSITPSQGFKYFESIGGLFNLNFLTNDSDKLPESHTCFNRIDIPLYETIEKFENKLTLAIECDTFAIH